jgi:hypothetical protein
MAEKGKKGDGQTQTLKDISEMYREFLPFFSEFSENSA